MFIYNFIKKHSYLIDESKHHFTHVYEVLPCQVVVHHHYSLHLLEHLVREKLCFLLQRLYLFSSLLICLLSKLTSGRMNLYASTGSVLTLSA